MYGFKAANNTVLKLTPRQAATLSANEKFQVAKGWNVPLDNYSYDENSGHYKLELGKINGKQLFLTAGTTEETVWYAWKDDAVILKDGKVFTSPYYNEDIHLRVPYYSQRDNYTQASRTCNSSACAMALSFLKPGSISGDNEYLSKVMSVGDTTSHDVQTQVLKSYGLNSVFRRNLSYKDVDEQLKAGKPVVIGILHNGSLLAPAGGHMITVIGKSIKGYYVNDPWGNLLSSYFDYDGANLIYPYYVLDSRWQEGGETLGWGRIFV